MNVKHTEDPKEVAEFIADSIVDQLTKGKSVLWFVPGGSAIKVATLAAEKISLVPHDKLIVTLTDERYGNVGHKDSNWQQLAQSDFTLHEAQMLPVLVHDANRKTTSQEFKDALEKALAESDYHIGLFGVGSDGHTAGILPGSDAVTSERLVVDYEAPPFERITITPSVINKLDEVVVFMQGKEKWPIVEDLLEKDIDQNIEPAQALKSAPKATLFTDYNK